MTTDQDYSALLGLLAELRALGVSASIVPGGVEPVRRRIWQGWPLGPSQVEWSRVADRLEVDTSQLGLERGPAFQLALREHAVPWLRARGLDPDAPGLWVLDFERDALAMTLGDVMRGAELFVDRGGHHHFLPEGDSFLLCLNSFGVLSVGLPAEHDERLRWQREVGFEHRTWSKPPPDERAKVRSMLAKLGTATQAILEARGYPGVELGPLIDAARAGTRLYRPGEVEALPWPATTSATTTYEVTEEPTLGAAHRLTRVHGPAVVALNFASARNPGGGWLGGARAQEESIARASALVPCLETQPAYYEVNRAERSLLYTDHLIYSPDVPVFRDDAGELLPAPWTVAFITSPAPNCGALRQSQPESMAHVRATFERRVRQVLRVAALHGHRVLVLGAWGCGAFRCDPRLVADVFATVLAEPAPRAAFEHVTFAIKGGHEQTLPAFRAAVARLQGA